MPERARAKSTLANWSLERAHLGPWASGSPRRLRRQVAARPPGRQAVARWVWPLKTGAQAAIHSIGPVQFVFVKLSLKCGISGTMDCSSMLTAQESSSPISHQALSAPASLTNPGLHISPKWRQAPRGLSGGKTRTNGRQEGIRRCLSDDQHNANRQAIFCPYQGHK